MTILFFAMASQMPDRNRIEAILAIREKTPEARIIVLTTYSGDVQVSRGKQVPEHTC